MLLRNLAAALCLFVAGLANGTMDSLQFHYSQTPYAKSQRLDQQFWNPEVSWRNKYKNGDPAQGERFRFSSTALVFTTDAWHAFKFIMLKCIVLAALFALAYRRKGRSTFEWLVLNAGLFVCLHVAFQLGFKLAYF